MYNTRHINLHCLICNCMCFLCFLIILNSPYPVPLCYSLYMTLCASTDVLHILNREARARKFAFQVLSTGCKYHLATESAEEREKWVKGLASLLFGPPQQGVVCEWQEYVLFSQDFTGACVVYTLWLQIFYYFYL